MMMRPIDADKLIQWLTNSTGFLANCEDCNSYGRECVLCIVEEAIQNAPTIEAEPVRHGEWISVKEKMPNGEDPVLILVKETEHYGWNKEKRKVYYCQYMAYWDGEEWFTTWCNGCRKISDTAKEPYADDYEVTHWMPLSEPVKED